MFERDATLALSDARFLAEGKTVSLQTVHKLRTWKDLGLVRQAILFNIKQRKDFLMDPYGF